MLSFSRSYSAPREPEQIQEQQLQFRNLALLYPWKDVLERVRRHGDQDASLPRFIPPTFDEDADKDSPLASEEPVRIIIAQDDSGVSLNRVLFDSCAVQDGVNVNDMQQDSAVDQPRRSSKLLSLDRNGQASSHPDPLRPSPFQRHDPPRISFPPQSPKHCKADATSAPTSPVRPFGHARRASAYVSLADGRNDGSVPAKDSKTEMESWLDCVFGKSQMRYRGDNTKLHLVQRQSANSTTARGASSSLSSSQVTQPALLISRTFTVDISIHRSAEPVNQPRPQNPRSVNNPPVRGPRTTASKPTAKAVPPVPTFSIAVLLPLQGSAGGNNLLTHHAQISAGHWHCIVRSLDALEAAAAPEISSRLVLEAEALTARYANGTPASSRMLSLPSSALQDCNRLNNVAESSSTRIARLFKVLHVAPRDEWHIWRDELREVTKSAKGLDSARLAFMQVALTAALTSNLSWMRLCAPPHLRQRVRREGRRAEHRYSDPQNRIIVATADHDRARQMIYLLSRFVRMPATPAEFARSGPDIKIPVPVSALTQGLRASGPDVQRCEGDQSAPSGPTSPFFAPPSLSLPAPSPVKSSFPTDQQPKPASPSTNSLQPVRGRIDILGKCTPAMPISSVPGSSYTTSAGSPDARPGSCASAQSDLLRHLHRNNSALSDTSTESGSFWNSLRSSSWSWALRRGSGATTTSGSDVGNGMNASQRGDLTTGILKSAKTSSGRNGGKKLVRMVEEIEDANLPSGDVHGRKDSGMTTPTLQPYHSDTAISAAFSPSLEYAFDATQSIVDVVLSPNTESGRKRCKVAVSGENFPLLRVADSPASHASHQITTGSASYDRVAGYLHSMHPDFALQAVKPSSSLDTDIKAAMRAESTPKQYFPETDAQSFPMERWVEVCSTMVIDADRMSVVRLTLRRLVCYTLTGSDDVSTPRTDQPVPSTIKITKSDQMDSVKRTYKRNDAGNRVDWKDKRVVSTEQGSPNNSGESSMTSSYDRLGSASPGSVRKQKSLRAGWPSTLSDSITSSSGPDLHESTIQPKSSSGSIGDDLTAFIDETAKRNNKATTRPVVSSARRVPTRNAEGKITGWKEINDNETDEPGLHDLPAGFANRRRQRAKPAVQETVLQEVFAEETISKPETAIVNLLDQMLPTSELRSAGHSRAGSIHARSNSRSNSICASGLAELQYESKTIIEYALEDLVNSVASERQSGGSPRVQGGGGLFGFRRQGSAETSVLRQGISKWLAQA